MTDRLVESEEERMKAIKAVGLVVLALLTAGPALADGRDHGRDRGRGGDDRGSSWVHRDRDQREWRRDRHRDSWNWERRHRRERFDRPPRHWMYGFRGRDEERRVQRRWWDHDRHRDRRHHDRDRDVIIISPFGGIFGRLFD